MWFSITNHNISNKYPLIPLNFNMSSYYDKSSGLDYQTIELNTAEDFSSLLGTARATNEFCTGIKIDNYTITFMED